jgi:hypothetical protein
VHRRILVPAALAVALGASLEVLALRVEVADLLEPERRRAQLLVARRRLLSMFRKVDPLVTLEAAAVSLDPAFPLPSECRRCLEPARELFSRRRRAGRAAAARAVRRPVADLAFAAAISGTSASGAVPKCRAGSTTRAARVC